MSLEIPISNYPDACLYLLKLKAHRGVALGLERMEQLVAALDHPERSVPCVHVAGTNGKGSVAAMIDAILREAGWKTGLYTSPHLVRLGERIQINREPLSENEITCYVRELQRVVATLSGQEGPDAVPSYFEFMTAMAFVHFSRSQCDIAVIEVGLGGRRDATNVVLPEVSVITSIGFDHCAFLGDSLAAIAREKGGIIKPSRPVVMGRLPTEAATMIESIVASQASPLVSVEREFGARLENLPSTNLAGDFQRWNAATATLAAKVLSARWRTSDDVIKKALQNVSWDARWQKITVGDRSLILDSTHNAQGADALETSLAALSKEAGCPPVIVVGVLGVERARPLMEVVCRHASRIFLVRPQQNRACSFEELESLLPPDYRDRAERSTVEELFPAAGICTAGNPDDTVVVTGSIYLAGEVLARVDPSQGPFEAHLQDF